MNEKVEDHNYVGEGAERRTIDGNISSGSLTINDEIITSVGERNCQVKEINTWSSNLYSKIYEEIETVYEV